MKVLCVYRSRSQLVNPKYDSRYGTTTMDCADIETVSEWRIRGAAEHLQMDIMVEKSRGGERCHPIRYASYEMRSLASRFNFMGCRRPE